MHANCYFWRTYSGVEIGYIEEIRGDLYAYEIKYSKASARIPKAWQKDYGNHFEIINKENYQEFIC